MVEAGRENGRMDIHHLCNHVKKREKIPEKELAEKRENIG
jgi:hypothetical protein